MTHTHRAHCMCTDPTCLQQKHDARLPRWSTNRNAATPSAPGCHPAQQSQPRSSKEQQKARQTQNKTEENKKKASLFERTEDRWAKRRPGHTQKQATRTSQADARLAAKTTANRQRRGAPRQRNRPWHVLNCGHGQSREEDLVGPHDRHNPQPDAQLSRAQTLQNSCTRIPGQGTQRGDHAGHLRGRSHLRRRHPRSKDSKAGSAQAHRPYTQSRKTADHEPLSGAE